MTIHFQRVQGISWNNFYWKEELLISLREQGNFDLGNAFLGTQTPRPLQKYVLLQKKCSLAKIRYCASNMRSPPDKLSPFRMIPSKSTFPFKITFLFRKNTFFPKNTVPSKNTFPLQNTFFLIAFLSKITSPSKNTFLFKNAFPFQKYVPLRKTFPCDTLPEKIGDVTFKEFEFSPFLLHLI